MSFDAGVSEKGADECGFAASLRVRGNEHDSPLIHILFTEKVSRKRIFHLLDALHMRLRIIVILSIGSYRRCVSACKQIQTIL